MIILAEQPKKQRCAPYPKLMISEETGAVALFEKPGVGVVLFYMNSIVNDVATDTPIRVTNNLATGSFVDYDGCVTLRNE